MRIRSMLSLFSRNDEMLIGKFAPLEMVAGLGLTICVGSLTKMAVLFNFFFLFPLCLRLHPFLHLHPARESVTSSAFLCPSTFPHIVCNSIHQTQSPWSTLPLNRLYTLPILTFFLHADFVSAA